VTCRGHARLLGIRTNLRQRVRSTRTCEAIERLRQCSFAQRPAFRIGSEQARVFVRQDREQRSAEQRFTTEEIPALHLTNQWAVCLGRQALWPGTLAPATVSRAPG
jgi:hypothetical protein